jgi:multidrug efflux pump subunit AcrA (membrane-fusion protein)
MGKGSAKPTHSAEYSSYLASYNASNPAPSKKQPIAATVSSYVPPLSEQAYYDDKYKRQQEEYSAKLAQSQKEQQARLEQAQKEQATLLAQQKAEQDAKLAELERNKKIEQRDTILSDRNTASTSAVDYVNQQIAREKSNAALFGIQYDVTDENKSKRIGDYFSTLWSTGQDERINNLFTEVGKPEGFTDFTIQVGDGSTVEDAKQTASQKVVGKTKGTKPNASILLSGLSPLGGDQTILGG